MSRSIHIFLVMAVLQSVAGAETSPNSHAATEGGCSASVATQRIGSGYRPLQVIQDSFVGGGWLVERNVEHPAWPARLTRIEHANCFASDCRKNAAAANRCGLESAMPEVRTGDTLVVVRETAVLREALEAVALSSGARGERIWVRTRLGGRRMSAIVRSKGLATFVAAEGGDR